MFIRIVKMTFKPEKREVFLANFDKNKSLIRGFEGCQYLDLLNDKEDENIFFTYSIWDDTDALENYRHSDLFKTVWSKTKPLFAEKPEAWSVDRERHLP